MFNQIQGLITHEKELRSKVLFENSSFLMPTYLLTSLILGNKASKAID